MRLRLPAINSAATENCPDSETPVKGVKILKQDNVSKSDPRFNFEVAYLIHISNKECKK